jgi:hypothetical protein
MLHVIEHFDYYNLGDRPEDENSPKILLLRRRILAELGKVIKRQ